MFTPSFLLPNRYTYLGFGLMVLGFLTLPVLIGLIIFPIGILFFIFGIHLQFYRAGKSYYNYWQKIKTIVKK